MQLAAAPKTNTGQNHHKQIHSALDSSSSTSLRSSGKFARKYPLATIDIIQYTNSAIAMINPKIPNFATFFYSSV